MFCYTQNMFQFDIKPHFFVGNVSLNPLNIVGQWHAYPLMMLWEFEYWWHSTSFKSYSLPSPVKVFFFKVLTAEQWPVASNKIAPSWSNFPPPPYLYTFGKPWEKKEVKYKNYSQHFPTIFINEWNDHHDIYRRHSVHTREKWSHVFSFRGNGALSIRGLHKSQASFCKHKMSTFV